MKKFICKISTRLKEDIKNPVGEVVENITKRLGVLSNLKVNTGKFYEIKFEEKDEKMAKIKIEKMAREILTNPIVEEYTIEEFKVEN